MKNEIQKVYIAAPFFNPVQLSVVEEIEWVLESHYIPYFSPRKEGVLDEMEHGEKMKSRERIFRSNVDSILECSHMIACIADRDTGTLFEVGVAYAQNLDIVLYADDISNISVMLSEASKVVCTDSTRLPDALNDMFNEYDKIGDTQ